MGAVIPDQTGLKMVTRARIKPPMAPTSTKGVTEAGLPDLKKIPQVQEAVRQTQSSRRRALVVAPWMDMVSSLRATRPRPEKVVELSAGLALLIPIAIIDLQV